MLSAEITGFLFSKPAGEEAALSSGERSQVLGVPPKTDTLAAEMACVSRKQEGKLSVEPVSTENVSPWGKV